MPTSDPAIKNVLIEHVKKIGMPELILDIGLGNGGYGERFKKINPNIIMIGIEIFPAYIRDDWGYSKLYDKIYIDDMRLFDYSKVNADLVIAGDVIEHVEKAEGIKVINELKKHFDWVLIALPIQDVIQGPDNEFGNKHEEHKHQWKPQEMVDATELKYIADAGICGLFEFRKV